MQGKKEMQHKELQIDNLLHKAEKEKVARAEEKREIKALRNDVSSLQNVRTATRTGTHHAAVPRVSLSLPRSTFLKQLYVVLKNTNAQQSMAGRLRIATASVATAKIKHGVNPANQTYLTPAATTPPHK